MGGLANRVLWWPVVVVLTSGNRVRFSLAATPSFLTRISPTNSPLPGLGIEFSLRYVAFLALLFCKSSDWLGNRDGLARDELEMGSTQVPQSTSGSQGAESTRYNTSLILIAHTSRPRILVRVLATKSTRQITASQPLSTAVTYVGREEGENFHALDRSLALLSDHLLSSHCLARAHDLPPSFPPVTRRQTTQTRSQVAPSQAWWNKRLSCDTIVDTSHHNAPASAALSLAVLKCRPSGRDAAGDVPRGSLDSQALSVGGGFPQPMVSSHYYTKSIVLKDLQVAPKELSQL
ncbi:hypothetical protein EV127DRAFT_404709 [Xylaria flabelliformis]|nr:hypothetical protein EV127DRAFT_404709 [Xylaria flabelliformis]